VYDRARKKSKQKFKKMFFSSKKEKVKKTTASIGTKQ